MGRSADFGTESFGTLLRRYRGRSGLTQEELGERAGLHAQEISKLERDVVRTPRSTTVEFLADALKLDERQRDALVAAARGDRASRPTSQSDEPVQAPPKQANLNPAEAESLLASMPTDALPERGPLPAGSRMPLPPNPLFVGRGEELLHVAAALRGADTTVALGQVVASTGIGGLGKTQLTVEIVHRYGRYFAGGVFWLSFASADEIPLRVAACANPGAMDLAPGIENLPLEERVQRVQRAWLSGLPRLLVFDNCEEEGLLETWRPPSGGCRVLVTSRRSHWSPTLGVTNLPLDLLPRLDSIELLRRYRPDLAPQAPGVNAIAQELGDLPLALHLAGSYLRAYRNEVSLDGYLAELQRSEIVQHASLLGAGLDDSPSPTHHVQSVAQTFALCLGRLNPERDVDRVATALLARMACMAPGEPVPRDLLAKTLEDGDPRRRADGLRRLGAVGLVEEDEGWLRLHRLVVHFVRQEGLDSEAQPTVDGVLIGCGNDAKQGHLTGPALAAVIPHLIDVADRETRDEPRRAELCNAAGSALQHVGDLRAARPWLERAVEIRERLLGTDHLDTATSLNNLAVLLQAEGDLAAANPLYERAHAIREQLLGPDHVDTATSLNNLAGLLQAQGRLTVAQPLVERSLAIRERTLGPDHPDTVASINRLAVVLGSLGEFTAAKLLLQRALATRERTLGSDHPHTAQSLNNLAILLWHQGKLANARPLFESALAIHERTLGPDHPDTAQSLNNLAVLLRDQRELTDARPIFERALAIRERVLGHDHPHIAQTLNQLAVLLKAQGELAAARLLFERALAIRERVLGADHPDTVATRRALAELAGEGDGPATDG